MTPEVTPAEERRVAVLASRPMRGGWQRARRDDWIRWVLEWSATEDGGRVAGLRILVGAVALATLAAGVAGCTTDAEPPSSSPSPSASVPQPTTSSPAVPTVLEVAVYGDERRIEAYSRIADAYTAQSDVRVDLVTYPDAATAAEELAPELDGFLGPDVFLLDQAYLPEYVAQGRVQPVDTLLEERGLQFGDDYQRVALTTFGADAGLQCMPAETSPLVVYYNRKLLPRRMLRAQGILVPRRGGSWPWEAFAVTARAIAGVDRLGPVKGAHIPADLETLTAFVRSAGNEVVDDVLSPTSLTLASEEVLQTVGEVASFARDPSVSLSGKELERQPASDWFVDGKLGMFVGTREDLPKLRAAERLRFDVLSLPAFDRAESVTRMNGYCIGSESDEVEQAADFIAFAVGEEGSQIAASSEVIVPSNLDMAQSDAFIQPGEQPRNPQVYLTAIRRSEPLPYSPAWLEVSAVADEALAGLYNRPGIDLESSLEWRMVQLDAASERLFADGQTAAGADAG
jgi:multiple sugar transport system substrate-binding protein